jgi:hypothetical protein
MRRIPYRRLLVLGHLLCGGLLPHWSHLLLHDEREEMWQLWLYRELIRYFLSFFTFCISLFSRHE